MDPLSSLSKSSAIFCIMTRYRAPKTIVVSKPGQKCNFAFDIARRIKNRFLPLVVVMKVQNNHVHPSENVFRDIIGILVSVNQTAKGLSYLQLKESAVASVNRSDETILPVNMNEVHLVIYKIS